MLPLPRRASRRGSSLGRISVAAIAFTCTLAIGIAARSTLFGFDTPRYEQPTVILYVASSATPKELATSLRNMSALAARLGPHDRLRVFTRGTVASNDAGVLAMDAAGELIALDWERQEQADADCRSIPPRPQTLWAQALATALEAEPMTESVLLRAMAELDIADEDLEQLLRSEGSSWRPASHSSADQPGASLVDPVLVIDASVLTDEPGTLLGGVSGLEGGAGSLCPDYGDDIARWDAIDSLSALPRNEVVDGFLRRGALPRIVVVASGSVSLDQASWLNWFDHELGLGSPTPSTPVAEVVARSELVDRVYRSGGSRRGAAR